MIKGVRKGDEQMLGFIRLVSFLGPGGFRGQRPCKVSKMELGQVNFRQWVHRSLGGVATSVSAHNVESNAGLR